MASFQIKNLPSIVAAMINRVRGVSSALTDFNIGAVIRDLLEAAGIEIDELYQQMFNALRQAIPVATYTSFNFDPLPAVGASGQVTVTIGASAVDVTIAAGAVFTTTGSRIAFINQADFTIAAGGTTGTASLVAQATGAAGNIPVSTAFSITPVPSNFVSASNAIAFDNGREVETEDERKQRFNDFIDTLSRATNAAIEFGAKTVRLTNAAGIEIERAKFAVVIEPYVLDSMQPIAWIQLFVHNGVGSTSGSLISQVDKVVRGYKDPLTGLKVPGWKAAGVKMDTAAATEAPVHCFATIEAAPGYDSAVLAPLGQGAIENYILGLDIAASLVLNGPTGAVNDISQVEGVSNVVFQALAPNSLWAPSSSSITAGTGAKTFTVASGKGFAASQVIQAVRLSDPTYRMVGTVTSYSGTSLVTSMLSGVGAGAKTDWVIAPLEVQDIDAAASAKLMPGTLAFVGV